MIGSEAIGFQYDSIIQIAILEDHVAVQFVMHYRLTINRHREAYRPGCPCGLDLRALLRREIATVAIIAWWLFVCNLLLAHLIEALRCTVAAIGVTRLDKL